MSKRFRGKPCIYCSGQRLATTGDHVLARQFCLACERADLPQVPACSPCNNAKSSLEHYLTAVLPFGAQHAGASENLETLVPGRLEKNQRLRRELAANIGSAPCPGTGRPSMTIPFDGEKLAQLFGFMARGLLWHEWGVMLASTDVVKTINLAPLGEKLFESMFELKAARRTSGNLGNGVLAYRGAQGLGEPNFSIWEFQFYSGVVLIEEAGSTEASLKGGVVTGPASLEETWLPVMAREPA